MLCTTDSADEPGLKDKDIEVTPEMIEAGFRATMLYDRYDPKDWEMAAVYRAMESERRRSMARDYC